MIFISSIVKSNGNWDGKDIRQETIEDILANYEEFRIVATEANDTPLIEYRSSQNLDAFNAIVDKTVTVQDYISSIEYADLVVSNRTFLNSVDMVTMRDLWDYEVDVYIGNANYGKDKVVPKHHKTDIVIENELSISDPHSTTNLYKNCLFVVDGIIHATMLINGRLFIIGAAKKLQNPTGGVISVVDFSQMGNVTINRITEENIKVRLRTVETDRSYLTECGVKVDDNLANKTYMVVVAGMFKQPGYDTRKLTENTVFLPIRHSVEIDNIFKRPTSDRSPYIDTIMNPDAIDIHTFDAKRLLSQGDSFIISFDRYDTCFKKEHVYSTGLNRRYSFYRRPNGLVFREDGRLLNYTIIEERPDEVIIGTTDNRKLELIAKESGELTGNIRTSAAKPLDPEKLDGAFSLDIYAPNDN